MTDLARVDHLLIATPDVWSTVDALEQQFGVRPSAGGRHAAWSTCNAILSLGPRIYLEVIGPDPEAPPPPNPRLLGIDELSGPRLATWVANGTDLPALVTDAAARGIDLGAAEEQSRKRPNGTMLSWTMTDVMKPRSGGVVPFFIDWGETPHPAGDAEAVCGLVALRAEHPDPESVQQTLAALGLELTVEHGDAPALVATLDTPNGVVVLR